jgi:hypothetical protein
MVNIATICGVDFPRTDRLDTITRDPQINSLDELIGDAASACIIVGDWPCGLLRRTFALITVDPRSAHSRHSVIRQMQGQCCNGCKQWRECIPKLSRSRMAMYR